MQQIEYAFKGLGAFIKAFGFTLKKGRILWYAYPLAIAVLLFLVFDSTVGSVSETLTAYLKEWIGFEDRDGWMATATKWILKLIVWYLFASINRYLVLILMSPILAFISEKTEQILTNKEYQFEMAQFVKDVFRGIGIAIRNLGLEYLFTLVIWVITLIFPPLLVVSPFVILAIQFYFYGFSFLDYNLERRRLKMKSSVSYIRNRKGMAIGVGSGFYLIFLIPFIGWIIAPVVSSVAATMVYLDAEQKESSKALNVKA